MKCVDCPYSLLCMAGVLPQAHALYWCPSCNLLTVPQLLEDTEEWWTPDAYKFHQRAGVVQTSFRFECEQLEDVWSRACRVPLNQRGPFLTADNFGQHVSCKLCADCLASGIPVVGRDSHAHRVYNLDKGEFNFRRVEDEEPFALTMDRRHVQED